MEDWSETVSSRYDRASVLMSSHGSCGYCTRPSQRTFQMEQEEVHGSLRLTEELWIASEGGAVSFL